MSQIQNSISYLLQKASLLSQCYEEQINALSALGDYCTEDIANDWIEQDLFLLQDLIQQEIISARAIDLYREIDNNFENASYGGKLFDAEIWGMEGLKSHVFLGRAARVGCTIID